MLLFWEPIIWLNFYNLNFISSTEIYSKTFELLFIGYFIFFIGITGLLLRHLSVIYILLSIELIFLGINVVFIAIGQINLILQMPIYVLLILTLAAAETAIMLSIIFYYHRISQTTLIDLLQYLKF
jgi:NADH-quinone oxidoreductase subunit K